MPIAQINGHDMYYEVHGDGPPAVYIGGWDTFCHGRHHYLARGMTDQFSTVIIDYRGWVSQPMTTPWSLQRSYLPTTLLGCWITSI